MNKYQLFSEHNNLEIYGDDPADAIMRQKTISCARHQEGERVYGDRMIANLVHTPALEIARVVEIEPTDGSDGGAIVRRGSTPITRMICETVDKKIVAIDLAEVKMGRPSVGGVLIPQITVSEGVKNGLEARAAELGISVPDARRQAYQQFCIANT
jgi:hypothetical protein